MTKTIRARLTALGAVELEFGFDSELIGFVKTVSGFGWDKPNKRWVGATHSLAALQFAAWKHEQCVLSGGLSTVPLAPTTRVQIAVSAPIQAPPIIMGGNLKLHDYQVWGAAQCLARREFVLVWSPRVGKTATLIAAGASGIATGMFSRVIVTAPAQVVPEWQAALEKQFPGMQHRELVRGLGAEDVASAHWVFVQHDQASVVGKELLRLCEMGRYMLAFDEPQKFQEWKAPRTKVLAKVSKHKNCDRRIGLTGTPMRNSPEDMAVFYEMFGGLYARDGARPWAFLKRYAGAYEGDYGWTTPKKASPADLPNLDELAHRLQSISHRLTREQVKPDLLPMHRTVRLCDLSREDGQRYKALEAALGKKAMSGAPKEQQAALKVLTRTALSAKLNAAMERIAHHCGQRGVKILVAAHWHESLRELSEAMTGLGWAHYLAGGWLPPEKRKKVTEEWRADPRPTPLLLNIVASGIGIDLSDADGSVVLEVPWVPADALQFEPRIVDVHLGKRTTQPWIEYLLARGTTDEDMALANLRKIAVIDVVVGAERESTGLAAALRGSGVVNTVDLGLEDKSDDAVEAALAGLRNRLMGLDDPSMSEVAAMDSSGLAGAVAEAFDDEGEAADEDETFDSAMSTGD